jgi:hypothetical protein
MVLAPIESLPTELLQPIFTAADHDVALVKASPYIAARLSSEYIYHLTCDYYLNEVHDNRVEQSAAQTLIFASKWMTWAFFQSWILRRFGPNGCLCDQTQDKGCFDAQWPPNFDDATKMVFSRSHLPRLAFVKARIPKKLLCGPWTQDKIEFLRFLLWITSMSVDPEALQAAVEERKQATLERNLEAVELFNHNRRLGRAADLDTVRFAVIEAGCDRSVVYDTLLAANLWNTSRKSRHSSELHGWCEAKTAHGDPRGAWLQKKLEESHIFRNAKEAEEADERTQGRIRSGVLDPSTGNYNGGPDDCLTVHQLEWNKVCSHLCTFLINLCLALFHSLPVWVIYALFHAATIQVLSPFPHIIPDFCLKRVAMDN